MGPLQVRLKNCIQTILDLEQDMCAGDLGRHFAAELATLRGYLGQVDRMFLEEGDVQRLEKATSALLAELRRSSRQGAPCGRLLQ